MPAALRLLTVGTVALLAGSSLAAPPASAAPGQPAAEAPAAAPAPPVTELPDAVSAMLAARRQGSRVEDLSSRSETTTVFANPDGTWTLESAAGPVRFRDESGQWRDVDVRLIQNADGSVAAAGHPAGLRLAGPGGAAGRAGDLVTMARDGKRLALGWRGALPRPAVTGNRAVYPDVLPKVDLVIEATRTGFEQFLVVKERPANANALQVSLPLAAGGMTVRGRQGGGLDLVDSRGAVVVGMPAPEMWDATVHAPSGEHTRRAPVAMQLRGNGSTVELVLAPHAGFLADPATVYPVTIDPAATWNSTFDAFVQTDYISDQSASVDLKLGTYDGGTTKARSFLNFQTSGLANRHILSATLNLWNYHSYSCSARAWEVWDTGLASTATRWTAQPAWHNRWATSTATTGYSTSCADGWVTAGITSLAQAWVNNGNTTNTMGIRASSETDSYAWKRFNSGNAASNIPRVTVTYNSYPAAASGLGVSECFGAGCSGTRVTGTTTPVLTASATDPDAGAVLRYDFELWSGHLDSPTGSPLATTSFTGVSSGALRSWTVPAARLSHGGAYEYRVRAYDGTDYGAWSPWLRFTVDLNAPAVGSVTSSAFGGNAWSPTTTSGTFTFTSPSTDVAGWRYWFDENTPIDVAAGATYTTPSLSPGAGWRVLHVQALDKGFNRSGEYLYAFGNGTALTAPLDGHRTAARVSLSAVAPPGHSAVRFQYRSPGQTIWNDIPVGDVTRAGSVLTAWPVGTDASDPVLSKAPAHLVWNVAATRSGVDGAVEVRAEFTGGPTSPQASNTVTATLETRATGGSYATVEVGPGSVTLVNGGFAVSAADASVKAYGADLTVARTFNSLSSNVDGVFGKGWDPSVIMMAAGMPWSRIDDGGSSVALTDDGGGVLYFAAGTTAGSYKGVGDALATGLKMTSTGSGVSKQFKLATVDGTVVTFTTTAAAPAVFRVATVQQPGTNQTSTYTYDASGRPLRMLAPVPPGVSCGGTPLAAGCRALDFVYSSGRITAITLNTTNTAGSAVQVAVACFSYDANGRLSQQWDPRTAGTTCGTPVLATGYGYDGTGRLTSVTPPGRPPWTIAYDATGRVSQVSRAHGDGSGIETTVLRYDVPIGATTSDAYPDLSPGRIAQWGQQVAPVTAVALFEPGDSVADLRDAEIYALDSNGRESNTATFSGTGQAGWKVETSEDDLLGRTARTLSARNRDLALAGNPTALGLPEGATSADIARALDEVGRYSADGADLLDTYGPWHEIAIDGAWVYGRAHTHYTWGQLEEPGADPTVDGPTHALIEETVTASRAVTTSPVNETDIRTTRTAYALSASDATGWTFRAPMAVTTEMGTEPDLVRQTRYNAATGQVIEVRQPAAANAATSPGTTKTTYYSAGAHNPPACVSSAWYGLACRVEPGGQPGVAGLPQLPVKTFEYDAFLRAVRATETVVDAGGATKTRTATTSYENAGYGPRQTRSEVTGGLGTAVPATTITYEPVTGLATVFSTTGTPAVEIRTQYDDFGRPRSVTDADGATTETTFHPSSGRIQTVTWKDASGATLGTQTFGYGGGTEHRGLTTGVTDSGLGGTYTARYDASGALVGQTMPNGITASRTIDSTGDVTKVSYAKDGVFWFEDWQSSNIHGQSRWHNGPSGGDVYGYDPAGRLRVSWDQRVGQPCVQRGYDYDANSNRTAAHFWPPNAAGTCPPSTTATSTGYTYDAADRLQPSGAAAGLTYDAFGRVTTLPAALASGTDTTVGYYATDVVASQSQGGTTMSWTLDPARRLRAATTTGGPTKVNHYSDTSDSPTWIDEGDGTRTRYVTGLDGNLAAGVSYSGGTVIGVQYQLAGLHGDIITTVSPSATTPDGPFLDYDEFGARRGSTPTTRYGWLGGKQRSADSLGGLILMGVRLYSPAAGRFLQVDPVECGSASRYDYAWQDPLNKFDLDGMQCTLSPDRVWGLFDFRSSCAWHDWCYRYAPYGRNWWGRYVCDSIFHSKMRASCRRMHSWWNPLRYTCYRIAKIYYNAVRRWGWIAFYF